VDRLAIRGLSHPDRCPLCSQEEEKINHLLLFLCFCAPGLVCHLARASSASFCSSAGRFFLRNGSTR
jgi:hypothetical protein